MAALAATLITLYEEQVILLQKQIKELKAFEKEGKKADAAATKITRKKEPVDPNKPKRAPSAYLLFMADQQGPFKAAHPEFSQVEIMTNLGKKWGALTSVEKASFENRAASLKLEFQRKLEVYNSTKPVLGPSSSAGAVAVAAITNPSPIKATKKNKVPIASPIAAVMAAPTPIPAPFPAVKISIPSEKVPKTPTTTSDKPKTKKVIVPPTAPAAPAVATTAPAVATAAPAAVAVAPVAEGIKVQKKKEKKRKHEESEPDESGSEKKKHHKKNKKE